MTPKNYTDIRTFLLNSPKFDSDEMDEILQILYPHVQKVNQ